MLKANLLPQDSFIRKKVRYHYNQHGQTKSLVPSHFSFSNFASLGGFYSEGQYNQSILFSFSFFFNLLQIRGIYFLSIKISSIYKNIFNLFFSQAECLKSWHVSSVHVERQVGLLKKLLVTKFTGNVFPSEFSFIFSTIVQDCDLGMWMV